MREPGGIIVAMATGLKHCGKGEINCIGAEGGGGG